MSGASLSHLPGNVRVASVQFMQRRVDSFDDFINQIGHWAEVASGQDADFLVLPELFTLQLLSLQHRKLTINEAISILNHYTLKVEKNLRRLALQHGINIIGGSHLVSSPNGQVENTCLVALRDGKLHHQSKILIPAHENQTWSTCSGNFAHAIDTDCGMIGILIGQDVESPELARRLVDQGATMLFTPFNTTLHEQYLRIRHAAQARVLENEVYSILCGNVGYLPNVPGMGSQYAQNAMLSACDFAYSHAGIISEGTANAEMLVMADLQPAKLAEMRKPSARPAWSLEFTSVFVDYQKHRANRQNTERSRETETVVPETTALQRRTG
ncbi:MAG TPA: nitrilase-related carbon-nitrogen hydrolase [Candidatus Thiothrix moscowensis]|uniref:nitrilase-related carbon-nitrogen hydrolase n=1 Tax=unclassified Thiothrix TaxID=2636184 RepID=UPI001A2931C9|nr:MULTISPECIES: nitrilase-related carbon-nitrogen hydrolase [unclassified Thiothrix]MBJ6608802.1 hypothetical protein [Candidatus Thiothrix moscowensis]HRJ51776.1 nitrilase-related carbon-nitrogen hydrolase [Candidatus Thiothrix moscowensis]HRJ92091.1 nitrilase-related carbon-nitrogen hydrolase [Candidatus Thiothrix moscowensis]